MSSVNPLSAEAEILNPLLIPLIDRMTFSEDMKAVVAKEEEKEMDVDNNEDDNDSEDIIIDHDDDIDIDIQDEAEGNEEEEDEQEGEDEEGEPFVEDNATESDNLSLEDMIEELEYCDEEDDESENDSADDVDDVPMPHDQDMIVDDNAEGDILEEDMDSDEASELIDQVNEAAVMDFIEENEGEMEEYDQQEGEDQDDPDGADAFNVIEIEEHPNPAGRGMRHFVEIEEDDDEDDMLDGQSMRDMGLHQILHMLQRRDHAGGRVGVLARNRHLNGAYQMGVGGANRRRPRQIGNDPRRGLDSLFQVVNQERVENDNDFWENNMHANSGDNSNRQRQNRIPDELLGNPYGGLLSREFQQIRDELLDGRGVNERHIGLNRARQRDRERNDVRSSNNPFEVLRTLQNQHRDTTENKLEQVCEVNVIDHRPSKEEIEKYNQEKEEKKKEKELQDSSEKKDDKQKDSDESKNDSDQNEIVERMDALGLRRASEDRSENRDAPSNQVQPPSAVPNEENKEVNETDQKENEDAVLESEAHSSPMQVEEQKEENIQSTPAEEQKSENQPQPTQSDPQPSQPEPQQQVSEADIRINNILETFNVSRQQVERSGIDLEVLSFLPEFELVSILSEVASNLPQEEPEANVQQVNEPNVPAEDQVQSQVDNQPEAPNQPADHDQNQSQSQPEPESEAVANPEPVTEPPQVNPPQSNQPAPVQNQPSSQPAPAQNQDPMLSDFFNSLLGSQQPAPTSSVSQALNQNQPANQPNDPMGGIAGALQSALMGMNAGMNQQMPPMPNPGGANQPPNPFAMPPNPFMIPNPPAQQPPQVPGGGNAPAQNPPAEGGAGNLNLPEGIDEEFFNSLPEEYKQELLRDNAMLRRNLGQPPAAEPAPVANAEQMDTASFLATIADENLRREILIGMDEQTLASLPGRLQNEARRYQRELYRRQHRRERDDHPASFLRRMMERGHDHRDAMRELRHRQGGRNEEVKNDKYDNFMEIIQRREEKYSKATVEAADISKNTISVVFNEDRNLKNLMKIIIIESQRKNQIKFEKLTKPFENL